MDNSISPLPEGWRRVPGGSDKFFYLTRHPQVKIVSKTQLVDYQKKSRYLEMNVVELDFGTKTRAKRYAVAEVEVGQAPAAAVEKRIKAGVALDEVPSGDDTYEDHTLDAMEDLPGDEDNVGFMVATGVEFGMEEEIVISKVSKKMQSDEVKRELKLRTEREKLETTVQKLPLNPDKKS